LREILYNGYTIEKMDSMEIIIIQEVVGLETLVALNFDLDRGPDLLGLFIQNRTRSHPFLFLIYLLLFTSEKEFNKRVIKLLYI
jgi:hypothetical protein